MFTFNSTDSARFWRKVSKSESCWIWTSAHNVYGYGVFHLAGKTVMAHRLSYEMVRGEVPLDMSVDHLCRVRDCVNPAHLEIVTRGENVLRGIGLWAQNKRKTHCPKGHPYVAGNIYRDSGGRKCRQCCLDRDHAKRPCGHLPKRVYTVSSK